MGTSNSNCYKPPQGHHVIPSKELTISQFKQQLSNISRSRMFESKRLHEFHHDKLPDLIDHHHKPRAVQRSKTHYESCSQIPNSQKEHSVMQNDTYALLRQSILEQQGSFFGFILSTYFKFLESLFVDFTDPENKTLSQPINPRCYFLPGTVITRLSLSSSLKKTTATYIKELAESFILIYDMLRLSICRECYPVVSTLPQSEEFFPQNELIIQRTVQYFAFMRGSIGQILIQPMVRELYRSEFNQQQQRQVEDLDKSLLPLPCCDELRYTQVFEASFQKYSELTRRQSSPEQTIIFEDVKERKVRKSFACEPRRKEPSTKQSTSFFTDQDSDEKRPIHQIPYHQTFKVLNLMCHECKFWRIWRLIDSLDSLVVELYLNQREDTAINELLSHITAEDSKSEVLFFVISKYRQEKPTHSSSLQGLYAMVKFMYEYDSILHQKVKFLFVPSFVRFYSILGMVIKGEQ